ncbi:parafibromin [Drosophila sechellia]|uniref:GM20257 n=1 Tax=Drosophila sechellia TaxID=7238 RepID=B4HQM3_DROSE|nr:parafibromin [Drosophila sechellia]EDW47758.1 GM20257 [Drosophila sechellia]
MDPILKTLTETMTVEAIAIIKAKRLAMKQSVNMNAMQLGAEGREKRRMSDNMQKELGKRAMERERPCRVFEEQLLGEREMTTAQKYLKLFNDSKMRSLDHTWPELSSTAIEETIDMPELPPQPEIMTEPPRRKTRYNRYGQEKFLTDQKEFGINPQGSNLEKAAPFLESQQDKQLKRNESVSKEIIERPKHDSKGRRRSKLYSRMPIIVVPPTKTSMVSLHNIKKLLQDLRYTAMSGMTRENALKEVIVEHRFKNEIVSYRVIDNVAHLTPVEWDRVIAVFTSGPRWQFKGWPKGANRAAIFHKVCAFHLHFRNTPMSNELRKMQVHSLALSPHERHSDSGILMEFWNKVDQHMAVHARQFAFIWQK